MLSALFITPTTLPGADGPEFYLVASSKDPLANLKVRFIMKATFYCTHLYQPLRTQGGEYGFATLTGSGSIGQFHFSEGSFIGAPRYMGDDTLQPNIGAIPQRPAGCTTFGPLGFTTESTTYQCALFSKFDIHSNQADSRLGAKLVFNNTGGFYACGPYQEVSDRSRVLDNAFD